MTKESGSGGDRFVGKRDDEYNAGYRQAENKTNNRPTGQKRTPFIVGGEGAKDYSFGDKGMDRLFDNGCEKWGADED